MQTVKVKAANDEAIVGAMETIGDRLPEVAIYGKVYADAELGNMLAEAYKEVIVFAVQATQYFQQRGYCKSSSIPHIPLRPPFMMAPLPLFLILAAWPSNPRT